MRGRRRSLAVAGACLALGVGGCAAERAGQAPRHEEPRPQAAAVGATVTAVALAYVFENVRTAPYFPFEGLAGVAWGEEGTLVVCDEGRGKVHGLDPRTQQWFEFDTPGVRPYRPVAARLDGFKILVLDAGSRSLFRFDLGGAYQDRLLDLRQLDPAYESAPIAFDIDVEGRLCVADLGEQQVLLLDSFLGLTARVGGPGPHREQFDQPRGICFLPDGGFMVSDQGNRRLQRFSRLGYWESTLGGPFAAENPFVAPQGLDCDRWGNVFAADPAAGVVLVLDQHGDTSLVIGPGEALKGTLLGPVDVALGPRQQLAVSDRLRGAVIVFDVFYE